MLTALAQVPARTPAHGPAPQGLRADASAIWQTLDGMAASFLAMLPLLAAGLVIFIVLLLLAGFVRRLAERALTRATAPGAATAIGRILYVALILLAALIAFTIAFPSMTPARLISVLGIGGIAVGFAFKDIFQNLFAGVLILLQQPFRIGDEITTGDFTGTVESIEARATFIRTYDGRRVIIPNGDVYTKPVTVISAYDLLRSEYDIGVGYGDDLGRAITVAVAAIRGTEGVLTDPPADALVTDLAGSSKNLKLRWWTRPKRSDVTRIRGKVLHAVADALTDAGIDLPFPTQVMLFHDQTEETDGDRSRQREGWPAGKQPPQPRWRVEQQGREAETPDDR